MQGVQSVQVCQRPTEHTRLQESIRAPHNLRYVFRQRHVCSLCIGCFEPASITALSLSMLPDAGF